MPYELLERDWLLIRQYLGFSVDCGSEHGGWNPRRMTNQMDPSSIPDPEARQKSFARQLSGLLISLRVCYCWIGAPGDVKWFLVKVLFLLSNLFFLWRMFELARLGGSQFSPLSSPCFNQEDNVPSAPYFTSNFAFGTFERNLFSLNYFQTIRSS